MPEQRINEKALTKDANGPTYQNPYSFYNYLSVKFFCKCETEKLCFIDAAGLLQESGEIKTLHVFEFTGVV